MPVQHSATVLYLSAPEYSRSDEDDTNFALCFISATASNMSLVFNDCYQAKIIIIIRQGIFRGKSNNPFVNHSQYCESLGAPPKSTLGTSSFAGYGGNYF